MDIYKRLVLTAKTEMTIRFGQLSSRKISNGGFETINRLFDKPINTVNAQTEKNTIKIGMISGVKVVSKT